MSHEMYWRLGFFFSVLAIMMLLEWRKPARQSIIKNRSRWLANFGLTLTSTLLSRLTVPVGLTAVAIYYQQHGVGLFNQLNVSSLIAVILSLLLLDLIIYWQHRLFHTTALLWRLHRVHHADAHIDTSTGLRFHPIEIVLSILIKLIAVTALGVPAIAVLIFEIAFNGLALFNHANIRLPNAIEKPLRLILITQVLHRIHHSQNPEETNSNFGFSVTWWDRLFGSYKSQASQPDKNIALGLSQYPNPEQNSSLWQLLIMPFKK